LKARINKTSDGENVGCPEFFGLIDQIEMALVRFESTSNHALLRLYKRSNMSRASFTSLDQRSSHTSEILEGKRNILTSHQNEHVFLVYLWVLSYFQVMVA